MEAKRALSANAAGADVSYCPGMLGRTDIFLENVVKSHHGGDQHRQKKRVYWTCMNFVSTTQTSEAGWNIG